MNMTSMAATLPNAAFEQQSSIFKSDFKAMSDTTGGTAWLSKAIHPPGGSSALLSGMPDGDTYPSAMLEFRNTQTINPPASVVTTWNVLMLSLPNPEALALYWTWSTGVDTVPTIDTVPKVLTNTDYSFASFDADVARFRRIYGSVTTQLNAPSLSDQGMAYVAQQRLQFSPFNINALLPAQTTNTAQRGYPAQLLEIQVLPTDQSLLMQISPNSYKEKAREGTFSVSRLVQPANQYQSAQTPIQYVGTSAELLAATPTNYGARSLPVNYNGTVINFTGAAPSCEPWSGIWTYYTGISSNATIEVKTIHGYEVQPSLGSPFTLFVQPVTGPDNRAIASYLHLVLRMQDGYRSSENFLGGLLAAAKAIAPKVLGFLKPSLSAALNSFGGGGDDEPEPSRQSAPVRRAPAPAPAPPPRRAVSAPPKARVRGGKVAAKKKRVVARRG